MSELEVRDIRFRSVVHSVILTERPATPVVINDDGAFGGQPQPWCVP